MSLNYPKPGLNNVPSYLVSGVPYVTRSVVDEVPNAPNSIRVTFPFVTRFFHIACDSQSTENLRFAFTENGIKDPSGADAYTTTGSNRNFFILRKGEETPRLDARCTELYFAGDGGSTSFEVVAGLTNIPRGELLFLTGTNGFEGIG
jgi:hypothetical protein